MTAKRMILALAAGAATLVISFVLTNALYIAWADWRYPGTDSMAGLSAFVLGLLISPVFGLASFFLALLWLRPRPESSIS